MVLTKGDFIEINFTGRIKDGAIFDSNIKEDLETSKIKGETKPFVFAVGEKMFVKGADEFLIGKDIGEYNIDLKPEDAFGKRDPKAIQMIPIQTFALNKINPIPGSMFNFDGRIAKILTVSGGRVMADFNNPIAGKDVTYKIVVNRKVEDKNEQIKAMNDFFFRKNFEFEAQGKDLIIKVQKGMKQFVDMFADKYKEILGLNLKTEEMEAAEPKKE
ncbi:MAG: FKBP-type peptidyl-prolyl cis-trans isomerase [Nanoarchaeota archaeon]|jgi:peptidylprolyl isomerase|nr:FKBP-type peptidyl-prolyl cis-trans isomerase [Nanoarchaeota archaeon]